MNEDLPDLFTYRGRSLEELVGRIRTDLGDDAVIVARRETRTGGFAGFFAKREIEVDVRPAPHEDPEPGELATLGRPQAGPPGETPAARAFREQLEAAQQRSAGHDVVSDDPALPRSASEVDVHDLFPGGPNPSGYGAAFDRRGGTGDAEVIPITAKGDWQPPSSQKASDVYEQQLDAILDADIEAEEEAILRADLRLEAEPAQAPGPAPHHVIAEPPPLAEGPVQARRLTLPPSVAPVACAPGELTAEGAVIARRAADRMVERGLDPALAERASAEAVAALLPFHPDADVRELVARALAQHLPVTPLRTGAAVAAFVGSGGSGKTRSVARLAAAYAKTDSGAVTVVGLRPDDEGAEIQRLMAPYDVQIITAAGGAEAAGELAGGGGGMVLIDTPAIVLRDRAGMDRLIEDLNEIGPDEVHVTLPATMSADAARELLGALAEIEPSGMTITHCDETFQLGTMLGLSVELQMPISYVGRGQAVDSGLDPIATDELAAELLC